MLEQGIVKVVQANSTVYGLCPVGGFLGSLPKDQARPSWSFNVISHVPSYCMAGRSQNTMRRLQIDCFGDTADDAVALANAIAKVLDGLSGTLLDADSIVLQAIFLSDMIDYFDDVARSYRRMLEVEVHYNQP